MSRIKTFIADGTAPNGRLYAGDLNLMQDQFADLSNFAQTHDVGTLRVGDGALQLLKYGTGEFRLTGAVRTDGLLRGLGGIIAGAFTTTARDAIALSVGLAPYGTVILNTTTNQYEWNRGTDAARSWVPLGVQKAVLSMGNGSATSFRLTHNFHTRDITVSVYETASPFNVVYPEIQVEDIDYIDIEFDIPPTTNQYRVVAFA